MIRFVLYREVFFIWSVLYRRFHCTYTHSDIQCTNQSLYLDNVCDGFSEVTVVVVASTLVSSEAMSGRRAGCRKSKIK